MATFLLGIIQFVIIAVVIPGILFIFFMFALLLVRLPPPPDQPNERTAKVMAFVLGLSIFVLIVILDLFSGALRPELAVDVFKAPLFSVIVGIVIGAVLLAVTHSFIKTRVPAVLIVILTASSLTSFYAYVFIGTVRDLVIVYTASILVGAAGYCVRYPEVLHDIFAALFPSRRR